MVVFVAVFFFCSTCIVGLGYVAGRGRGGGGGGLRLGVNIVKCRVQECHNLSASVV